MKQNINSAAAYFGFLIAFLVIDGLWIALFAEQLYRSQINELLRDKPQLFSAVLFYLAYGAAVVHLCFTENASLRRVQINAAVLGATAYGTYAATNYAMLNSWTLILLITDIIWGVFVTVICSSVAYWAGTKKAMT